MKLAFLFTLLLFTMNLSDIFPQTQQAPALYAHRVIVEEILQTQNYTYLRVKERINEKDSMQWLALPSIKPSIGDVYYFESGLQMGEFHSKELNRTFDEILFLANLSTSREVSAKNIIPVPEVPAEDTVQKNADTAVVHTVVVKKVLQTSGYTYLLVKEGNNETWVAVTKIPAVVGESYTYDDAAMMNDFTSKELNRTFKEILFIAKLKLSSGVEKNKTITQKENKADSINGLVSIAALYENKNSYAGKIITVKGEVTKYSSDILSKNWIHIKDGTSFSGKSDLTITTDQEVKIGESIIVNGKISLDKDFGSGYFFDVIMEDAKVMKD